MVTHVLSIGTALPSARLDQSELRDFFASQPGLGRLTARLIGAAFEQSAIDSRYSVIGGPGTWLPGFIGEGHALRSPSTRERNDLYRREAPGLFAAAARDALARSGRTMAEITHVITASCTGLFAPGPDFLLVKQLGISPNVERYHLGFMGCAAAFPALRAAARICEAQPGSVVLVACAELCSLHVRTSSDPEQIVASAIFGDGAAAAIVASDPSNGPTERTAAGAAAGARLEVGAFGTAITHEGEADMDWSIGDAGFDMRLSAQVPRIIGQEIAGVVQSMLGPRTDPLGDIDAWAVHPGGRSVLDRVQSSLGLPDSALAPSRAVLRDYGNMSSATILFILQRLLEDDTLGDRARVASLCFGPGLTVETALFTRRAA